MFIYRRIWHIPLVYSFLHCMVFWISCPQCNAENIPQHSTCDQELILPSFLWWYLTCIWSIIAKYCLWLIQGRTANSLDKKGKGGFCWLMLLCCKLPYSETPTENSASSTGWSTQFLQRKTACLISKASARSASPCFGERDLHGNDTEAVKY